MHVLTYESLNSRGEQLVFLLKNLLHECSRYLKKELIIELVKINGRHVTWSYNEKNLNKLYDLLIKGEVIEVLIFDNYPDKEIYDSSNKSYQFPQDFSLALVCNKAAEYPAHFSNSLVFSNEFNFALNERLFENSIPFAIQELFLQQLEKWLKAINGIFGFITYESIAASAGMISPYENYHGINPYLKPGYYNDIKGYFWATYLSEAHIKRLGGEEYIVNHAPAFIIKMEHPGMLLQLTNNINNYSDEQLRSLRTFLFSLLPAKQSEDTFPYAKQCIIRLVE